MTILNPDEERRRLVEVYARSADGELLKLASESWELSEVAQTALVEELQRRGLEGTLSAAAVQRDEAEWVMLRRYRDLTEAMLTRGALESSGIPCELSDENMVRMDWFLSNLLGGVKLFVRAPDVEAAEELLAQPEMDKFNIEGDREFERPRCPQCNSLEIAFEELNKPVAFATAYLGVPIPLHHTGWRCHSCGAHWEESGEE